MTDMLTMKIAVGAAALLLAGCSSPCSAPSGTLHVTVTSAECQACSRLAIIAQSPKISAAIASGQSPCAESLSDGPTGCVMGTVWVDTYGDCGGSACGPYDVDLGSAFLPAASRASPAIDDTVAFCPFDASGSTFTPAGNCVSSLSSACSSGATLNLNIDGVGTSSSSTGGSGSTGTTGSSATSGSSGGSCLALGAACTAGSACCSTVCDCATSRCVTTKIICN